MILQGTNLIISTGGSVVAASKSCTLEVDADIIGVSTPTDGAWDNARAGRKSWAVSTNCLLQAAAPDQVVEAVAMPSGASNARVGGSVYTIDMPGLNVLLFNPADGTPLTGEWANFATNEDESEYDAMIDYLNGITGDFAAIIVSYDGFGLNESLRDTISGILQVSMEDIPLQVDRGALAVIGGAGAGVAMYAAPTGETGASVTVKCYLRNGMVLPDSPLRESVEKVGQLYDIRVQIAGLSMDILQGQALCKTFRCTGTRGNLMQGTFQWKGCGPLL